MSMVITKFYFKDKPSADFAAEMLDGLGLLNRATEWTETLKDGRQETFCVTLFSL